MSLAQHTQHTQRAQFTRQRQHDEAIKQAYAESVQREAAWIKYINKGVAK